MDNARVQSLAGASAAESLLRKARESVQPALSDALADVFDRLDDLLFDFIQKSVPAAEQQPHLDAMRILRRERAGVEERFAASLAAAFDGLRDGTPVLAEAGYAIPTNRLSLVSEDDLEVQLAAKLLATALRKHQGELMAHFDACFARLIDVETFDTDANPVAGPHIAVAVYRALQPVDINVSMRVILLKLCERELPRGLEAAYQALDRLFVEYGVATRPGIAAGTPRPEETPTPIRDEHIEPAPVAPPTTAAAFQVTPPTPSEQALFGALNRLLAGYRSGQGFAAMQAGAHLRPMSPRETLVVVNRLQGEMPAGLCEAIADRGQSLVSKLKGELLAATERLGFDPATTCLATQEEDAVDLVGMLFDVLLDERHLETSARMLIGRLILPFVKVALIDRRMFVQKTHPARRLLNALAEACEGNGGETPPEKALMQKVEGVVDRLIAEFNEDLAIFHTLEEEFRAFLEQHRKRIELAERRAAEALRGRERLDQARARAALELERRVGQRELTPTLDLVLRRYWPHHLTMMLLREGENSEAFRTAAALADDLASAFDIAQGGNNLPPRMSGMRIGMEAVFASSGATAEAAGESLRALGEELRRLARGEAAIEVAASVVPPMAEIPPPAESEAPTLRLVANRDALDYDPKDAERIRALAIGTWVEFIGEDGTVQPAKYSWTSPISGRLMFVNRRGIRICVASAEELAEMMKCGRLALRPANAAFERAMHQVLGKLQSANSTDQPMRASA